jgi:hypothetical protein
MKRSSAAFLAGRGSAPLGAMRSLDRRREESEDDA